MKAMPLWPGLSEVPTKALPLKICFGFSWRNTTALPLRASLSKMPTKDLPLKIFLLTFQEEHEGYASEAWLFQCAHEGSAFKDLFPISRRNTKALPLRAGFSKMPT